MTNTIETTREFTVAQIATAWKLARAYAHAWGYVPLDEIVKCSTLSEIKHLSRYEGKGNILDIFAPNVSRDCLTHRTFSGRLYWSVNQDGNVVIDIFTPLMPRYAGVIKPVLSVFVVSCETDEGGIPQSLALTNVVRARNNKPDIFDEENDEYVRDNQYVLPEDAEELKSVARFHRRHVEALNNLLSAVDPHFEIDEHKTIETLFKCARPDGYIISQNTPEVDYIRYHFPETKVYTVRESISAEEVRGCDLVGNVPLSIAAAAKSVAVIEFDEAGANLKKFTVSPA